MCVQRPLPAFEEQLVSHPPDFLRAGGRYRVRNPFGTGHAWSPPSKLGHEYEVYTTVSGSTGIYEAEHRKYVSGDLSSNQTDVLRVWETNKTEFLTPFAIAMDYLSIQTTSVPCERVSLSDRPCKAKPVLMEALQLLKFALKKQRLDSDLLSTLFAG